MYLNAESLIKIFNPTSGLLADGTMYIKLISWSLLPSAVILLVAGILQGVGNARTPMIIVAILNIINILFSYLLIFGNLYFPRLGLRGAGIAYNISYFLAASLALVALFREDEIFIIKKIKFNFHFNITQSIEIIKFGLPVAFESIFWQLASIIISRAVLSYGDLAYSGYQLALQAISVASMPAAAFNITASTFIGQSVGLNNKKLGSIYFNILSKYLIVVTSLISIIFILFPKGIMRIFSNDLEVIEYGASYLFMMGLAQIPQSLNSLLGGTLRGSGYANIPMIITGLGIWTIRIPLLLIGTYILKKGINWIWLTTNIDLIFRCLLISYIFKKKDIFKKDELIEEKQTLVD